MELSPAAATIRYAQREKNHAGARYQGEISIKTGQREGKGTHYYTNPYFIYEGEWLNGKKHGQGRLSFGADGFYEGSFAEGEISGKGRQQLNGWSYQGEFLRGQKHGEGTLIRADGGSYTGGWAEGKYSGHGALTLPSGETYVGGFQMHKFHGQGSHRNPKQAMSYEGEFCDGLRHGHGQLKERDGASIYVGQFQEGRRDGQGKSTDQVSGISYEGLWRQSDHLGPSAAMSSSVTAVRVAGLICVSCRSKSEEKCETFRMHDRLAKVALGTTRVEHFHVDSSSSQEWQDLQRDLGPYLRKKDYIRVGSVAAGAFKGLRAVGIGSRDKALRRALNVALALSVVRQRGPFVPEALGRLLLVHPIPVMGGKGPPPVKAKPAMPLQHLAVDALEEVSAKRESANVKPVLSRKRGSSSPEAKDTLDPEWLPQMAQLVTRIERLEEQLGTALPVPGSGNSEPSAELSAAPEEEVDYTGDSDVPTPPDRAEAPVEESLESTALEDVKLEEVKMEPMEPVEPDAQLFQNANGVEDADGTTELFVDEVRYSQQSCCDRLQNGKMVEEEVEKIVTGKIDPLKADWLKIEVFQMKSFQTHQMTYYSSDNRRLLILKMAQERLPGRRLKLRAKVERVPPCFRKFMRHFNTRNDGMSIRVKSPKGFLGSFKRSRGRARG
eukprot:s2_g78.t1